MTMLRQRPRSHSSRSRVRRASCANPPVLRSRSLEWPPLPASMSLRSGCLARRKKTGSPPRAAGVRRSRVGSQGYLRSLPDERLDDREPHVLRHHRLGVGIFMVGRDYEVVRMGAHRLVLRQAQGDRARTAGVSAFAYEVVHLALGVLALPASSIDSLMSRRCACRVASCLRQLSTFSPCGVMAGGKHRRRGGRRCRSGQRSCAGPRWRRPGEALSPFSSRVLRRKRRPEARQHR